MQHLRLTYPVMCAVAAVPILLSACAGHTAPARSGDIEKPVAQSGAATATSALSALTKSDVVPANARSLPNQLLIGVRLDQTLSTAKPTGFAFATTVAEPVTAKDGAVAMPTGTVFRGVISAIRAGSATQAPVICVKFDFLELSGRSYGIRSSVKNVLVNGKPATILPHDSLAKIFPNQTGLPLSGTAIALPPAAAGEAAELPAGTLLVIRLDSAIAVPR